jgi:hypothetical protein
MRRRQVNRTQATSSARRFTNSGPVLPFNPASITGCQLWLDADDTSSILLSGSSNVSIWFDKSNTGTTAIPTRGASANQITYVTVDGYRGVYINNNGAIDYNSSTYSQLTVQSNFQNTADYSIFAVVNLSNVPSGSLQTIYGNERGTSGEIRGPNFGAGQSFEFNTAGSSRVVDLSFIGSRRLQTALISSSSALTAYNNTTAYGSATNSITRVSTDAGQLPRIGGSYGSINDPRFATGYFHEILFYNSALTTVQRQKVEGYLAHKWGLAGTYLPTTPLTIPGCQLWLDVTDSTTTVSSGNLTSIKDKSTSTTTTLSSTLPTYNSSLINGLPGISFNGSSFIRGNFSSAYTGSNFIVFTVASMDLATHVNGRLISFSVPGSLDYSSTERAIPILRAGGDAAVSTIRSQNLGNTTSIGFNTNYLFCTEFTGSTYNFYLNGSRTSTASSSGSFNISTWGVGYLADYGGTDDSAYWRGTFGECIIYFGSLTTTQRQTIETYLANKWGLQPSLPINHPYKTIPPTYEQLVFVPTLISGSQIWLDGADPAGNATLPSIGGNVSTWTDKSGNGLNGTATGTIPVFASGGGITFSAGAYNTSYSSSLTNECLFVVFSYTRTSGTLSLVGQTGDGARLLSLGAGASTAQLQSSVYNVALGALSPNTTVPINTIGLGELFTTNSSMDIFYNGTSVGTPTAVTITSGRTSIIGGASTGGSINTSQYFGGIIYEVIGFTGQLTPSQRKRVEGYLAQKWGLHSFLPANHPYKTIAPIGIPRSITIQSVSALFTASNNPSLTIPASSVLTLGTNNHTIEFWMYQTSRGDYDAPFMYGNTTAFDTNNYYFNVGSFQFKLHIGNGAGGWAIALEYGTAPSLNAWHHYAIVRNGTTFTLYVNGTSRGSATSSVNITAQGDVFRIGNSTTYPIAGYISNFRLVNGTAVYTSNFTPPTSPLTAIPNTQILIQGLVDRSPNSFTVTNNGSVALSTSVSPFV